MAHKGEPQGFQFVTVTRPGHDWKDGNEHIVRSHVMKQVRRKRKLKVTEEAAREGHCGKRRVGRSGSSEVCNCQHQSQNAISTNGENAQRPNLPWTKAVEDSRNLTNVCSACANRLVNDRWNLKQLRLSNQKLSFKDERLFKHISNFFSPIVANISQQFLLWTKGIIMFMAIAESHDFVMHALLGWSATHLAPVLSDKEMELDGYRHRDRALKGLQKAILCFSEDNADAVLCASVVMSWQSCDASWANIMRGCESVKAKMTALKKKSCLETGAGEDKLRLNSDDLFDNTFLERTRLLPSQSPQTRDSLLKECIHSLAALQDSVGDMLDLKNGIDELTAFLRNVQDKEYLSRFKTRSERLKPLKDMVYWFPRRFLPKLNSHPSAMLLMAHLHACALFIEPAEDSDTAYFRRLNASPIQAFYEEFSVKGELESKNAQSEGRYQTALALLEFPLKAVADFQNRLNHFSCDGDYEELSDTIHCRLNEFPRRFRHRDVSTLTILESFPVGLWHNSLA